MHRRIRSRASRPPFPPPLLDSLSGHYCRRALSPGIRAPPGWRWVRLLFRILGPVAAEGGGGEIELGAPRHRLLLATLLTSPGRAVSVERLVEALWGDEPPRRAAEMLHVRISELRRLLRAGGAPDLIVTHRPGYALDVGADQVDAHRFAESATLGRHLLDSGDAAGAATRLGAALALWRGPALADLSGRAFARPEIARLESLRVQATEDRITAELAAGRHHEVIAELDALVRMHPLHEQYRQLLMLALYRSGRQGDALRTYRDVRDRLRDELGVDPGDGLQAVHLSILRHDLPSPRPRRPPEPPTSFVGRRAEVDHVGARLADARLVTLSGVGGSGKTRLALRIAHTRHDAYPDGVWVAELADVAEAALVPSTVAVALGVRERPGEPLVEAIVDRLRPASALLVVDSCEHLLDGVVALTGRVLAACPRVQILCTSRERLGVTAEAVCPVAGLSTAAAVELSADRAAAVREGFALTDDNAAAVREIVTRLDGLPLSIELAAARIGTLSAPQIAARLSDRFGLLSRGSRDALPRHRSLRAALDWSYGLLTPAEQRFFRRLAVFDGGFTLDGAQAVCPDLAAAEVLARLVDKSLVVVDPGAPEYRYRLLETLRAYGLDEPGRCAEVEQVRAAHTGRARPESGVAAGR